VRIATTALFASALLVISASAARAVPGSLDPRFGTGGLATAALGAPGATAEALALQPDGKIVVAGWMWQDNAPAVTLVRYLPDGSVDPAFFGGSWTAGAHLWTQAVALQADGKILVAGPTYGPSRFVVKRFRASGTPDPSFGTGGEATLALGESSGAEGIGVQPDGKIVAVGFAGPGIATRLAVVRLHPGGTLDATFGTGGVTMTPIGRGSAAAEAVALRPDGKVVAAASTYPASTFSRVAVAQYDPNGSLDTSFGSGGVVTTPAIGPYDAQARALALQPDGKIVVAGFDSGRGLALDRYTASGQLDPAFGSGGHVLTELDSYSEADGVAVQPDGKIVAVGRAQTGAVSAFAVARYELDGSPDRTFGRRGVVLSNFSSLPTVVDAKGSAVGLQPDGKIVVGGTVQNLTYGGLPTFGLARFLVTPGCRVPDVRRRRLAAANRAIVHAGCSVGGIIRARSNRVARGRVISQRPRPGAGLAELGPVSLVVSKGKR
jgi:uncharacterized delta-60 repeat protein